MSSIPILTLHLIAAVSLFTASTLVVVLVIFLPWIRSKGKTLDKRKKERKIVVYLLTLLPMILIFVFVSFTKGSFDGISEKTITIVGQQWIWTIADGEFIEDPDKIKGGNEITLPLNEALKFRIISTDVFHDLAIYSPNGNLLIQTQAIPYKYSEIFYKFTEKGSYQILCLEYCGLAHAYMMGKIHVK